MGVPRSRRMPGDRRNRLLELFEFRLVAAIPGTCSRGSPDLGARYPLSMSRNGERGFYSSSPENEWIEIGRLREIIEEVEAVGGKSITAVDLLNRLGIEDDELDLLKQARAVRSAGIKAGVTPQREPFGPGRRHMLDPTEGS